MSDVPNLTLKESVLTFQESFILNFLIRKCPERLYTPISYKVDVFGQQLESHNLSLILTSTLIKQKE